MMRNAVLTVMGETVIRVLSGDNLDESERNTRDRFLDTLQDHIHDVNVYVRSCVLQIFNRIVKEKVCDMFCNYIKPLVSLLILFSVVYLAARFSLKRSMPNEVQSYTYCSSRSPF